MSASVRPSIPRPRTSAPPAARTTPPAAPGSGPSLAETSRPPAMRERLATLDLEDADIVGVAVKPIKTGPPPAPLPRKTSAPPPVTSIPAAPASSVAPVQQLAAGAALVAPRVPT
ncbi:MAG: hypothetical protein K0S65_3486, partial [Labilithrix sp.]|nr:hypothetical protein [Labilithrix sp.]